MSKTKKTERSLFRKIQNGIIFFILGILFIFFLAFAFTQTETFREYARNKIIETVDNSIEGKISIGKIDGSLFTSLIIRDVSLYKKQDTLATVSKIELNISPLQLLLSKIYIRNIVLDGAKFNLQNFNDGTSNLSRIFAAKSDTANTQIEEAALPDSTAESGGFPFILVLNNLQIIESSFSLQNEQNLYSNKNYKSANFDDLRISHINLQAEAAADLAKSDFFLNLKDLEFIPNLNSFVLKKLKGKFRVNTQFVRIENFALQTAASDVEIDVLKLDDFNLFDKIVFEDLKNNPLFIDIYAKQFDFDDLTTFVPATGLLKGTTSFVMNARGIFNEIQVDQLIVDYNKTHLNFNGKVLNLNKPEKLFIDGYFNKSSVEYKDVLALLPKIEIPVYKNLNLKDINIAFKGEPTNFAATIEAKEGKGTIHSEAKMNFNTSPAKYDIKLKTKNLSLEKIINIKTKLNLDLAANGRGFSPEEMNTFFNISLKNSKFDVFSIDTLHFKTDAKSKKFDLFLFSDFNNSNVQMQVNLDLNDLRNPIYNLNGELKNLNLAEFVEQKDLNSALNFQFNAQGSNLNLDSLNGNFFVTLAPSVFKNINLEESVVELTSISKPGERKLSLKSDFLDFSIFGDFSVSKAIELLSYQADVIPKIIAQRTNELNPMLARADSTNIDQTDIELKPIAEEDINFNFDYQFKDFELIATMLEIDKFSLQGSGSGNVNNDSSNFSIKLNTNVDYFFHIIKNEMYYFSDTELELNFSRDNHSLSFNNLLGSVTVNSGRVFSTGTELTDIYIGLVFNFSKLFYDISAVYDGELSVQTDGELKMGNNSQSINFENITVDYKNAEWQNSNPFYIMLEDTVVELKDFNLSNNNSRIHASGLLDQNNTHQFNLTMNDIEGKDLLQYITSINSPNFSAKINTSIHSFGSLDNPVINFNLDANKVSFGNIEFGDLTGTVNYSDNQITPKIVFNDPTETHELLSINGSIPMAISYTGNTRDSLDNKNIDLKVTANNFDIKTFGDYLPAIYQQNGKLNLDLTLNGSFDKPDLDGFLDLKNCNFKLRANGLNYNAGLHTELSGEILSIDSMIVKNSGKLKQGGTLNGKGKIVLKAFKINDIDLIINGSILALNEQSKSVSPDIYGDLFLRTDGNWNFKYKEGSSNLSGKVFIENSNLTFAGGQGSYTSNSDINYQFVIDSSKINQNEAIFIGLLNSLKNDSTKEGGSSLMFDYNLGITIENDVSLTFLLSPVWNHKLVVVPTGSLFLDAKEGISAAQGTLLLTEGSKFEYFKTLEATGKIRFEGDVANPYIDIVAKYKGDWQDAQNTTVPVEVRIKLEGSFDKLGEKLASDPNNFTVYVGKRNIDDNIKSSRYDDSDAISFIFVGKFKDELSTSDKKNLAQDAAIGNTAYAFLGSVITSFVNSAIGDVVNNIQLNQAGENTRFKVSGKIKNIRYSIGGTQDVFQDINKADIKIEYLFSRSFLIRLERKEPVVSTSGLNEKISELGFKYRFQF